MKKFILISLILFGLLFGVTQVWAIGNWALNFDGENDYVEIPYHSSLNASSSDFEIEIEFRTDTPNNDGMLVNMLTDNDSGFVLYLVGSDLEFYIRSDWGFSAPNTETGNLDDGNWHNIIADRVGDEVRISVDGGAIGNQYDEFYGSIGNTQDWNIGTWVSEEMYFTGDVRKLKMTIAGELVLHYDFSENYGAILHDLSGYGNNGTIYGATWIDPETPAVSWLPITSNFPAGIVSYVRSFLGSGMFPFIAMIIGIPLSFVIIRRVIDLMPKK